MQSKDVKFHEVFIADNNIQPTTSSRHEEFTDRATNSLEGTQNVRLGEYEDVAPIHSSAGGSAIYQEPHMKFNMEAYDLNGALSREYQMPTITWTTAQAQNTGLAGMNFPDLLFSQPFIADKIKDFKYFRGGLRITVRVTTTRFLYGKVMLWYEPFKNYFGGIAYDPINEPYNVVTASGLPHVIISASAGDAVVFDIPFISPFRALDVNAYGVAEMAIVHMTVLNPLVNVQTAGADSCKLLITAQFLEPELMFPHNAVSTASKNHKFETQSKEVNTKSQRNLVSNSLISSATVASKMGNTPFIGQYAQSYSQIASGVASIMKVFGLDKPTSVQASQKTHLVAAGGFNHGKGLDNSEKLGTDPENKITSSPNVGGFNVDEMDLKYIAGIPMLLYGSPFRPSDPDASIWTSVYDPNDRSYLNFLRSQFGQMWGSVKIKIYIEASIFHSIRAVIYLVDDAFPTTEWENCYHQVIDIQGSTEFETTIPWCEQFINARLTTPQTFTVFMKILTWSQPDMALDCPIYLNVYQAGASDIQFGNYLDTAFDVQSNPREDFSRSFKPLHEKMTAYDTENFTMGEKYINLREVLHKYQPYYGLPASGLNTGRLPFYNPTPYSRGPNKLFFGIEKWSRLFRFWRGSIRMKIHKRTGDNNNFLPVAGYTSAGPLCGGSFINTVNPCVEVEMPYYSTILFHQTTTSDSNYQVNSFLDYPGNYPNYFGKCAGDDFSFHFLQPPPIGTHVLCDRSTTLGSGIGWQGLIGLSGS